MNMFYRMLFPLIVFIVFSSSTSLPHNHLKSRLPSYIKPCKISDPEFDKCCLQHGKDAYPFIIKGDRKYQIPSLTPLSVPIVKVDAGKELKIELTNVKVDGLADADIQKVKIDIKNKKITLKIAVPALVLTGKYEVDGKLMILPLKGKGDFNITGVDGTYEYTLEYNFKKVNNLDYVKLTDNDKFDFKLGKAIFKLENLFNGDEKLGKQMNDFLNENWQDVIKELGGAISHTVSSVGRAIASGYFNKIPYRELFLE